MKRMTMPGISFICDLNGGFHREFSFLIRQWNQYDERYQQHQWLNSGGIDRLVFAILPPHASHRMGIM